MTQTRKQSLVESLTNVLVGYLIAWAIWTILIWAMDLPIDHGQSAFITAAFTVVSLIRNYVIRRFFDRRMS